MEAGAAWRHLILGQTRSADAAAMETGDLDISEDADEPQAVRQKRAYRKREKNEHPEISQDL